MKPSLNSLKINTGLKRRNSFSGIDYHLQTPTSAFPTPSAALNQPAKTDSMKFSRFICSVVYQILGRFEHNADYTKCVDSTLLHGETVLMSQEDFEFAKTFQLATTLIHRVLKATCHVIPLAMVVYGLKLIDMVVSSGKRTPAKGSEPHFFAIALMLAQKMNDDHSYTNKTWAKIMGVSPLQVSFIEREFVGSLDYQLNIKQAAYSGWFAHIQALARTWETVQSKRLNALNSASTPKSTPTSALSSFLSSPPLSPGQSMEQMRLAMHAVKGAVGNSFVMKTSFMVPRSRPY